MDAKAFDRLLERAGQAFEAWKGASRLTRRTLVEAWLEELPAAREAMAREIVVETGKPISLARGEVGRAEVTLRATAEAIARFGEESVPYDLMAGAEGCRASLRRFPRGVVLALKSSLSLPPKKVSHPPPIRVRG